MQEWAVTQKSISVDGKSFRNNKNNNNKKKKKKKNNESDCEQNIYKKTSE